MILLRVPYTITTQGYGPTRQGLSEGFRHKALIGYDKGFDANFIGMEAESLRSQFYGNCRLSRA